jgi:hypothetical protein
MYNHSRNNSRLTSIAALAALTVASAALARTALAASVTRVYIVDVPAASDHAFREGVAAWHRCERANGDRSTVLVYDAETGDLSRYAFLEPHASWADMDNKNPADEACRVLFRDGVLPTVKDAYSEILQQDPKITYMPGGDPDPAPIVWVSAFRFKPGQSSEFHAGLGKFAAAAAKTHWQGHWAGYDVVGAGQGGEDFLMLWPNKNWADVGTDPKPSDKEMMDSVYGKSAAEANHKRVTDSIADVWSDAWSYDKELSVTAQK